MANSPTAASVPSHRHRAVASKIRLTVLCAKNLFRGRVISFNFGLPDVYCKIESGGQTFTTETCVATANPKWRVSYDLQVTKSEPLLITLWNQKRTVKGQRGFLGCVRIKPADINTLKDTSYQRLTLQKLNESDSDTVKGEIIVSILSRDSTRTSNNRSSTQNNVVITDQSVDHSTSRQPGVVSDVPVTSASSPIGSNGPAVAPSETRRPDADRRSSSTSGTRNPLDRSRASSARMSKSDRRSIINSETSSSNPQIFADTSSSSITTSAVVHSGNNSISNRVPVSSSRHLRGNSLTDPSGDHPRATRRKSSPPHLRQSSIPVPAASSSQSRGSSAPAGLPKGYEMRLTTEGQVQYVHTESGAVSWYDPRVKDLVDKDLDLDKLVGPLPPGWELRQSNNRTYFVNHVNRTTQLTDPRLVVNREMLSRISSAVKTSSASSRKVVQPPPVQAKASKPPMPLPDHDLNSNFKQPNRKILVQKMQALRQEFAAMQPQTGHCRLEVCRDDLFEESYRGLMKMKSKELKKKLMVKFRGEEGIDYGGVAREWLYLLSREMLNPCYGLFLYTHEGMYTLHINPNSAVNPDHLSYFHFVGRVIGLALFHGHYIGATFSLTFYRMLLNKAITLDDIRLVDPELHRGLEWMLNNDCSELERSFSVDNHNFGEHQILDLIPNGRNVPVTEENKEEYVRLYVNHRFKRGIEHQFQALLKGFQEVIPPESLHAFDEKELAILISGFDQIDIDDWKANTRLKHCNPDSPIVKWFWKVVENYSEEKRARLLQFVTGSPRVPLQGFKALQGTTGASEPRLFTINQIDACTDNLPQAHTCFNRIDIPPYESFAKLQEKLTQAIDETDGFALD